MPAVRVYTSSGWQDVAQVGPAGKSVTVYEQAGQPTEPVPNGSIWIDTDEVPVVSNTIRTMRTGQSYIVSGAVASGQIIPTFFVPIMGVGQTTKIIGFRAKIASGTSIAAQLQQNGVNIGGPITVTTVKTTTTFGSPVTIADGDEIGLVLSAATAGPANLSLTVIFEHTV